MKKKEQASEPNFPLPPPIHTPPHDRVESAKEFLHHDKENSKIISVMLCHIAHLPTVDEYWMIVDSYDEDETQHLYHTLNNYRGQIALAYDNARTHQQNISMHIHNTEYYIRHIEAEAAHTEQGQRVLHSLHMHRAMLEELATDFRIVEAEAIEQLRLLEKIPHAVNGHAHHWLHYDPADLKLYPELYASHQRMMATRRN